MAQSYDTLDSVDTNGANDIADVYQLVAGEAMEAPDLCGWMSTGPLNQCYSHGGYWGRYPLSFEGHPEVWFVRCAPVGSIGKPLKHGELRQISVLVRESETSKNSVVTNIKLWRRPRDDQLFSKHFDLRQRDRGWATLGPIGVASHAIHIFERRWNGTSHVTLPSVATITRSTETHSHRRIEPVMMTHYVLASSMIGMNLVDTSTNTKICEICYKEPEWESACTRAAATFKRMCMQHVPSFGGSDILKLLVSAEDVCEQSSFIGYLDQRADPFYIGAMQDDMHKPCGMPLIIAAAVCIASNTERWGLPAIRCDDGFATREANFFIESTLPPILPRQNDETGATEQIHSIDVAVNYALANITMFLNKVQAGQASTKGKQVNPAKINSALMASMNYLMYTGIAVCVDLFGLPPKRSSGQDGLYTPYGFAKHLVDPVMMSRVQSGHDKGLGNTVPRWDTKRTSTRGRRQLALASVLVEVDQWLRTGKYKGVVLHPHSRGLGIGAAGGGRADKRGGAAAARHQWQRRRCRRRPRFRDGHNAQHEEEAQEAHGGAPGRARQDARRASARLRHRRDPVHAQVWMQGRVEGDLGRDQAVRRGRARVLGDHQRHHSGARVRRVRGHRRPLQLLDAHHWPREQGPVRALRQHRRRGGEHRVFGQTGQVPRV